MVNVIFALSVMKDNIAGPPIFFVTEKKPTKFQIDPVKMNIILKT